MSVLLTVKIVSHNPAQSSLIIFALNLQTITITLMMSDSVTDWHDVSVGGKQEAKL